MLTAGDETRKFGGKEGRRDLATPLLTACLRETFSRRLTVSPVV